jgi:hypothetical protein
MQNQCPQPSLLLWRSRDELAASTALLALCAILTVYAAKTASMAHSGYRNRAGHPAYSWGWEYDSQLATSGSIFNR